MVLRTRIGLQNTMFCPVIFVMVIAQHVIHMEATSLSTGRPILHLIKHCEKLQSLEKISSCSNCNGKEAKLPTTEYWDMRDRIGATYIRWGRNVCNGKHTETVYSGQGGGKSSSHKGSGVNNLCLPNDPDNGKRMGSSYVAYLYGAEYKTYAQNKPSDIKSVLNKNDVPCAVCLAKRKYTVLMIPGRKRCYKGWKKEYHGYLMSSYYASAASDYACVDVDAQTIPGGSKEKGGNLFYPVKTTCGSLRCPPYTDASEVYCVVCTR